MIWAVSNVYSSKTERHTEPKLAPVEGELQTFL
jgi:hypothetical protein